MHPKWTHKYQLKPGRWVFEPSVEARAAGLEIKKAVRKKWSPPSYFFHLSAGGHVAALKAHSGSTVFAHVDIRDFFSRVNRSRVTRCLKSRVGYKLARQYAIDSTVRHPTEAGRYILPYGFIQSPILASLALHDSALGSCLENLRKCDGVVVSVFMDDIVLSCSEAEVLGAHLVELKTAATRARFDFNDEKEEGPAETITAFNIDVRHQDMRVSHARMLEFNQTLTDTSSEATRTGIRGYVGSVNAAQAATLG